MRESLQRWTGIAVTSMNCARPDEGPVRTLALDHAAVLAVVLFTPRSQIRSNLIGRAQTLVNMVMIASRISSGRRSFVALHI